MVRIARNFAIVTAAIAMATVAPAFAQNVELDSDTKLVVVVQNEDGTSTRNLEEPNKVVPGDRVVFAHSFRNAGPEPATEFVIDNPLPSAVIFRGTEDSNARVSVDGGETYGRLDSLTVAGEDGAARPATADDVTHVRWLFPRPIAVGETGVVSFEGEVR